jgi:hypothetical protein
VCVHINTSWGGFKGVRGFKGIRGFKGVSNYLFNSLPRSSL